MIEIKEIAIKKRIEEEGMIFSLREDGIFCTETLPNTHMTIEKGRLSTKITDEMQEGKPYPLLCDLTNVVKITKDCREHFSGLEHSLTHTATALVVTNPISKIIGNFFIGFDKPIKPTKLFTSKEKAIEWLKTIQ